MAIRMPRYFHSSFLLPSHPSPLPAAAAPPACVPFFGSLCQPRHGEGSLYFSELGNRPRFLFPAMSSPWKDPAASTLTFPSSPSPAHSPSQLPPPAWSIVTAPPNNPLLPTNRPPSACSSHLLPMSLGSADSSPSSVIFQFKLVLFSTSFRFIFKNPTMTYKSLFVTVCLIPRATWAQEKILDCLLPHCLAPFPA